MPEKKEKNDGTIFIGQKPFLNYVTAVTMQFTTQGQKEVVIKGRGKFISRCVDVAEVVTKRFMEDKVELKGIKIDSEEFENKEGKRVRVSTIDITLAQKEKKK